VPADRCGLPACASSQLRSCRGGGECRIDYESDGGARQCFDNGVQVVSRSGDRGDLHTVFDPDGSVCFSVAVGTDSSTGELGAIYLDADGDSFAVAGLRGSSWAFVCDDGTVERIDGLACGLFAGLPPGVSNIEDCRPGRCEPP
jgi:hypothetical protein